MSDQLKFKYENISGVEQVLIGVGKVAPGKTIESDQPVHNPNIKLGGGPRMVNVEAPVEQPKATSNLKAINK